MLIGFSQEDIREAIRLSASKSVITFGLLPRECRRELRRIMKNRRPRMVKRGAPGIGPVLTVFVFQEGFKAYYNDLRIIFHKKTE